MTHQQAIRILILSPVYFRLETVERMQLIKDYCKQFRDLQKGKIIKNGKR